MNENVVKQKSNNGLIVLIILLTIIVLGLTSYIIYEKVLVNNSKNEVKEEAKKEETEKDVESKYTYKDVTGVYEFTSEPYGEANESDYFSLTLYENGIFRYDQSRIAGYGYYGNYTIDGDKINLNYIFSHGSDASVQTIRNGNNNANIINNSLIISSNNVLIDTKIITNFEKEYEKVELKKTNMKVENAQIEKSLTDLIFMN